MKETYTKDEVSTMINEIQAVYIDAVTGVLQESHPQETLKIAVTSMAGVMKLAAGWDEREK